jgi:hypothetical protein
VQSPPSSALSAAPLLRVQTPSAPSIAPPFRVQTPLAAPGRGSVRSCAGCLAIEVIEVLLHGLRVGMLCTKRDWYANLLANPHFIFHLKQSTQADLRTTATPITDDTVRRQVLTKVVAKWDRQAELEAFVQSSPLVEVELENI